MTLTEAPPERRSEVLPSLSELTEIANREHGLVLRAGTAMLEHAVNAGEALLAAKQHVPRGEWTDWLTDHFDGRSLVVGQQYMRLARHKRLVMAKQPTTIKGALRLLHGGQDSRIDPVQQAEVLKLRSEGMTIAGIAEELQIPKSRVQRWVSPKVEKRRLEKARQRTIAGRRALNRQKRDAAARKAGGSIAEAYALIRRALQACEKASEEDHPFEVKRAVSDATNRLYNAEDAIVRASKGAARIAPERRGAER